MIDQIGQGRDFDGGHLPDAHLLRPRREPADLRVADVNAIEAALQAYGARFLIPMEERWYRVNDHETGNRQFVVADPDGYLLRFFEDLGVRGLRR